MHRLSDHTIVDGAIVLSDAQLKHLAASREERRLLSTHLAKMVGRR